MLIPSDFRRQLAFALVVGIISTAVISTFVVSEYSSKIVSKNLANEGKKITETFASQSTLGLLIGSVENIEDAVTATLNFPNVEGIGIYYANRKPLVERGQSTLATDVTLWKNETDLIKETDAAWYFIAPVYSKPDISDEPFAEELTPELLGYVRIVKSKAALKSLVGNVRKVNVMISLGLAATLMLLLLSITQRVTKPLKELMGDNASRTVR